MLQQLFIVGIYACKSQFNIPDSTAENKKQQPLRF